VKRCRWVKPVLIAQVKFAEWTHDDQLRQPVFLGLQTDKEAKDITLRIITAKCRTCGNAIRGIFKIRRCSPIQGRK
jgi:ATP-dependent DNA ligase